MLRHYTNLAVPVALQSAVDGSATVLSVSSTAGFPDVPFTLAVDRGTEDEEVVLCTTKGASSFTVDRGYDETIPVAHASSAPVEHVVCAMDYRESGIPRLTTTQRDALSGINRWTFRLIANTTTSQYEYWTGSEWNGINADVFLRSGGIEPELDLGNVTGNVNIDFSLAHLIRLNPTGTVTLAWTNLPASGMTAGRTLIIANSNQTVNYPVGTRHPDGEAPELDGETWLSVVARGSQVTVGFAWGAVE